MSDSDKKGMQVTNLKQNITHLVMAIVVIAGAIALCLTGHISGADALTVVIGVGGFSMGGGVASSSAGTLASLQAAGPSSSGVPTSAPNGQTPASSPAQSVTP